MRGRASLIAMLLLASAPLMAQTSLPVQASAANATSSCVDVSVNDRPALSYECLNQHLAAAASGGNTLSPQLDAVTREPSNRQLGQFNFSAFSIRMGDNLGKSVVPQRPPPPASMPLLGVPVPVH
jgi:hypothetical protein